jgi:transaldolase
MANPHRCGSWGLCRSTRHLRDAEPVGSDIEEIASTLEEEGIVSFARSWDELIASVSQQIEKAGAVVLPAGAVKPAKGSDDRAGPAAAAPGKTSNG